MTFKKVSIIAAAGAILLAGAIGIAISLTSPNAMEINVVETPTEQKEPETDGIKTLENMEHMPLYFDDTEKLLLPLRNVMEGLGGSVQWDAEQHSTVVTYRGRRLELKAGETEALLNGYPVTLPDAARMINGCLYADAAVISAYYTDKVAFDRETLQVTLQAKDSAVPVVAVYHKEAEQKDGSYAVDVPVIVGLNDGNFEKSLNGRLAEKIETELQLFLTSEKEGDGELRLELQQGFCSKEFLSLSWIGTEDGTERVLSENIDLLGQKPVTLADMLTQTSLDAAQDAAGAGWTAEQFYLTAEGELILTEETADGGQTMQPLEAGQMSWQKEYQGLFAK